MPRGGAGAVECEKVRYQIFEVRLSACTCYYKADTKVELSAIKPIFRHGTVRLAFSPRDAYLRQQGAGRATPCAERAAAADTTHHPALT